MVSEALTIAYNEALRKRLQFLPLLSSSRCPLVFRSGRGGGVHTASPGGQLLAPAFPNPVAGRAPCARPHCPEHRGQQTVRLPPSALYPGT